MSQIFLVIELLLKLVGLYDQFMDWSDKRRIAQDEIDSQERSKAADALKGAQTEKEFDDAQDKLVSHLPRP